MAYYVMTHDPRPHILQIGVTFTPREGFIDGSPLRALGTIEDPDPIDPPEGAGGGSSVDPWGATDGSDPWQP